MRKVVLVVLLVAALGAWAWWNNQKKQNATPPNAVSGTIECDEVHIASRYGGRVVKIFATEGATLTNGQPLVELAAPELLAQRAEAAAMLADLEAGARPEELAVARSEWESATTELELARSETKRALELFQKTALSEIERDRAVTRVTALEKSVAAARSRHELLAAGPRTNLVQHARATLDRIDTQLAELRVTAPTNCVLEVLSVKPGDVLAPNREVATLLLTDHLWARVFVPQAWLGRIQPSAAVTVRADAFPGREFTGAVEQMARAAEFTPRNVQTAEERVKQVFGVKVRLENPGGQLRAGLSVEVKFPGVEKGEK